MKKKSLNYIPILYILLLALVAASCSKINKATDLITKPTAKEVYERQFKENPELYELWQKEGLKALEDSVAVSLPYAETGIFFPANFPVYSYDVALNPGEELKVELLADSLQTMIFMDLYRKKIDSVITFEHVESSKFGSRNLTREISEPGVYKIIVQPEIEAHTPFKLVLYKEAVYTFPVASIGNSAVQSFWGAQRDGGRRSHEGIDIFAKRGTPVIAATSGRVTSTADKGLGGKQVWLKDNKRGNSLYYAHLDSIIARRGMSVSPGDTLGLVGNSGNARTTAPHLHFGIYKGYRGAINPLPYVYEHTKPEIPELDTEFSYQLLVKNVRANLRTGPSTKSDILKQTQPQDTLQLLGKTADWYHIRHNNRNSFIHQSLVSPI